QSKPCASCALSSMGGTLVEPFKDPFYLLFRNSDSRVGNSYFYPPSLVIAITGNGSRYTDSAPFRREFHRVAQKVVKDLLDSPFIEGEEREGRGTRGLQVNLFLLRDESYRFYTPIDQGGKIGWHGTLFHPPRLHFGEIKDERDTTE